MRAVVATVLGVLAISAGSAQAQDRAPALTNAEACLRDRAADAVAVSAGAADAADFLLNYLCAEAVTAAARYRYNTAMVGAMQGMMGMFEGADEEALDGEDGVLIEDEAFPDEEAFADGVFNPFGDMQSLSVDQTTGEIIGAEDASGISGAMGVQGMAMEAFYLQPSVELRALAGQLILDARRP